MLTNCLAACARLTITVSEIQRDIYNWSKIVIFFIPLFHSTPPLGGSRWNSATPFCVEKLEWLSYHVVKNFEEIFIRFGATHERDGRTDGHRVTAKTALMHRIAR